MMTHTGSAKDARESDFEDQAAKSPEDQGEQGVMDSPGSGDSR